MFSNLRYGNVPNTLLFLPPKYNVYYLKNTILDYISLGYFNILKYNISLKILRRGLTA